MYGLQQVNELFVLRWHDLTLVYTWILIFPQLCPWALSKMLDYSSFMIDLEHLPDKPKLIKTNTDYKQKMLINLVKISPTGSASTMKSPWVQIKQEKVLKMYLRHLKSHCFT